MKNNTSLTYDSHGVEVVRDFLDKKTVDRINIEIDLYLKLLVLNRSTEGCSTVNKYLKEIKNPATLINSCNLLEMSIDVRNILFNNKHEEYRLTKLALYIEKKNPDILPWHRDNDPGIITAQIYLKGGDTDKSGAFQYMVTTQNMPSSFKHHLSSEEIQRNWSKRVICYGMPGDLVLFNWYGYHSKTSCVDERRTIFLEFQHKSHNAIKSDIKLSVSKISIKVIDNISLFEASTNEQYIEKRYYDNINLYISAYDAFEYILLICKIIFKSNILDRIKRIFPK